MIPPYTPGRDWLAFQIGEPGSAKWYIQQAVDNEMDGMDPECVPVNTEHFKLWQPRDDDPGFLYGWIHFSLLEVA